MTQFSSKGFSLISTQVRGEAEMHLNKRYITFTRSLLEEMGNPSYVQLLLNAKDGIFALRVCKPNAESAYKLSKSEGATKKSKYCSTSSVLSAIITSLGKNWDESKYYGFRGLYYPSEKAMEFNLNHFHTRNVESFIRHRG
jgi:hypothetical protein